MRLKAWFSAKSGICRIIKFFSNQKMLTLKKMQKPHIWGVIGLAFFDFWTRLPVLSQTLFTASLM